MIAVGLNAKGQNTLSLSSTQGHPGDTVTVSLSLANSDAVSAMQTFIPLGTQLTYVSGSAALSSRSNGHQMTATVLRDTLRIYVYSLGLNSFSGTSGALLTFQLVLGNEPAAYSLSLCNTRLSNAVGTPLAVTSGSGNVTILAPKISLSPSGVDYGHCPIRSSYTRSVTVHNIGNEPLTLYGVSFDESTLSAGEASAYQIAAGGQRSVTISYLPVMAGTVTRHGIFHSNAKVGDSILNIAADPYAVNELRPLAVSGYTDSIVTVQLRMNNMDSIVGLQTGIKLPGALSYIPGSFAVNSSRSNGHTATAGVLGDTLVMLVSSMENRPLRDGDGVVASFQLRLHGYGSYTLRLLRTILADTAGRNVLSAVYTGNVQIYSPRLSCNSTLSMGESPVTSEDTVAFNIYNNGNASLVIDQVNFTAAGFTLATPLPLTVASYQNGTLAVVCNATTEATHTALMQIYSNDPFNTLKQVSVSAVRYEPNAILLSSDSTNTVENAQLDIELDNYSNITALQADVVYPHRYCAVGNADFLLTARSANHTITAARQNDSTWRMLLFSMQNVPFQGNSGPVLNVRMHLLDTLDEGGYPVTLRNVRLVNADGRNMSVAYDSTVYIATRVINDTTYITVHDTTVIVDTVVETEYVHDTTVEVDTLIQMEYVHDTTVVVDTLTVVEYVHDTTVVDNYIHDTTIVDNYIHDTTVVVDTLTLVEYVHDTTYIDHYIHDTTYIDQYIHDTTVVTQYVHDTTVVTQYIHDTVTEAIVYYDLQVLSSDAGRGIGVGSGHFPEGTAVQIAALPLAGNRFLQWSDGGNDNPRTVTLTSDISVTAVFVASDPNNIENPEPTWRLNVDRGDIVVSGLQGEPLTIYDINGRTMAYYPCSAGTVRYTVPATGSYVVRVGSFAARKVTVIR